MLRKFILIFLSSLTLHFSAQAETAAEERGWTAWAPLGGQILSDPAACTYGNLTYVFARGTDNGIWYRKRYLPTGIWADWKRLPNIGNTAVPFTGSPAAYCGPNGPYDAASVIVMAVGNNGRLYAINGGGTQLGDGWGAWYMESAFNAMTYSGPAIAGWMWETNYFFARGGDNRIYVKTRFNSTSTPWQVLFNGPVYNDPTAVMSGPDRLDAFVRDQYGRMYQLTRIGLQWQPRQYIAGVTYSGPEVVSRDRSSMDLFARGANNTLIQKRWVNGVWGSWVNLGGSITSGPGAATYASGARIFVFARWSDGSLYYRAWAP